LIAVYFLTNESVKKYKSINSHNFSYLGALIAVFDDGGTRNKSAMPTISNNF